MAGSIWNWSTTAASNGNADAGINFAEGQAPSTVNDSARQVMGRIAEYLKDYGGALTVGGTANAITVTANSAFTAYADGLIMAIRIASDNAANGMTINVNALGAKAIRVMIGAGEADPPAGAMKSGGIALLRYGTSFNGASGAWMLLNPVVDTPNLVTLTGTQTLSNKTLAGVTITGTSVAPTQTAGDSTTNVATTAFVTTAINALSTVYQGLSSVLTALAGIGASVAGDIIYATGANAWARLAKGTASQALLMNAGATAPVWTTVPFTKSFESAQQTITSGGSLTLAHGLGVQPKHYAAFIQCVTAELGYSIGQELPLTMEYGGTLAGVMAIVPDATNLNIRFGNSNPFIGAINFTTGAQGNLTNANWKLVVRAWA